jgi:hypothetical protein
MATNANAAFDKQNSETDDIPQGGDTVDNSYATTGSEPVPVVKDEVPVEQPNDQRNPDSDAALGELNHIPLPQFLLLLKQISTRKMADDDGM